MGEALSPCPFPLRWPPALLIHINALLRLNLHTYYSLLPAFLPSMANLTLQKVSPNSRFTIYSDWFACCLIDRIADWLVGWLAKRLMSVCILR